MMNHPLHPAAYLQLYIDAKKIRLTNFYESLLYQFRFKGKLSPKQTACITRALNDSLKPYTPETEDLGDFEGVIKLFDNAKSHLKYPKIRLTAGDNPVVLAVAGNRAKFPGTINVSDGGPWGDNVWYGRITREGKLEKSRSTTFEVIRVLKALAKDPAKVAEAYGKKYGYCCFCARELTDDRSVAAGYGPVCADHYGLKDDWKVAAKEAA